MTPASVMATPRRGNSRAAAAATVSRADTRALPTGQAFGGPLHQHATPLLCGLGAATPQLVQSQQWTEQAMAEAWGLRREALDRWRRIVRGSGIEQRQAVVRPQDVIRCSTGERMVLYERHAPALATEAALGAMRAAGVNAADVTDLIVVSCTGFSAPGVDVTLIEALGLSIVVRRLHIGFMGCFGGISGLRAARAACCADPRAVALLVCVELCSLHMRDDVSAENQVASALFADGAAAAVVVGAESSEALTHGAIGRIDIGATQLIPEGKSWMTWKITDAGFAMTLRREVPAALRSALRSWRADRTREADDADAPPRTFIVHPGGPGVLDAAADALDIGGTMGIEASWRVLRRHGNMSSGTVLFVLAEALRSGATLPATLLAFGPGLTIERIDLTL